MKVSVYVYGPFRIGRSQIRFVVKDYLLILNYI